MEKHLVWGGWRKRQLLYGGTVLANVMLLGRGCVIVNEQGWGRRGLEERYKTIDKAKTAAEAWAQRRAVRKGVRDDAKSSAGGN